jgi:hypothetical protein
MKIAFAAWLLFSSVVLADPDLQPACRERCEEVYGAELQACANDRFGADECRSAAEDRHQECIDRCND